MVMRIKNVNETLLLLQQRLLEQQEEENEKEECSTSESACPVKDGAGDVPPAEVFDAAHTLALVDDAEALLREQESRARSRSPGRARPAAAAALAEMFVRPEAASSASPVPPRPRPRANSLRSLFANPPPRTPTGSSTPGSPTPCDDRVSSPNPPPPPA